MIQPVILDGFCKAGGAGMGLHRAGFRVVGVDIEPQPHYPFEFIQADWFEYMRDHWREYDAFSCGPHCKKYGKTKFLAGDWPMQIERVREFCKVTGKPYVIENVIGAPLINPIMLTGPMFGLNIKRDRLFECSFPVPFMLAPTHQAPVKMGRPVKAGDILQPVGHFSNVPYAREQMGIDWMTQAELSQAIPPVYLEYVGKHMMQYIRATPTESETK